MNPELKLPHIGPLWLSAFASVVLGPFLGYPTVLGMLFRSSGCPLGCGYLLCPYVPHSHAPQHTGVDVGGGGLRPYKRCMATEGHFQCRNPTTSRALDVIAVGKVGIDVCISQGVDPYYLV